MGQKSGSVINVASVAGLAGAPMMSHYGAAKAAIISLTRSVAVEWAWAGVRVNTLLPGWIQTELTQFLRDAPDGGAGALARFPCSAGDSRRDRRRGRVPGLGCIVVHDRPGVGPGRRPDGHAVAPSGRLATRVAGQPGQGSGWGHG